jgi:hypothetical protein
MGPSLIDFAERINFYRTRSWASTPSPDTSTTIPHTPIPWGRFPAVLRTSHPRLTLIPVVSMRPSYLDMRLGFRPHPYPCTSCRHTPGDVHALPYPWSFIENHLGIVNLSLINILMEKLTRVLLLVCGIGLLGLAGSNACTFVRFQLSYPDPLMMIVETFFTVGFVGIALISIWIAKD